MRSSLALALLLAAPLGAQAGTYTTFGSACQGSGTTGHVVPLVAATAWGNSANSYPFGYRNLRFQQEIEASEFPKVPQLWRLMALREDTSSPQSQPSTMTFKILLGTTTYSNATLTSDYAKNATGTQTKVFDGNVVWPGTPNGNTDLKKFHFVLHFIQPYVFLPLKTGENFLVEVFNTTGTQPVRYPDNYSGSGAPGCRLYAAPTATTGTIGRNHLMVMQFGSGPLPNLSNTGVPTLNQSFSIDLDQGLAQSAAGLILGASNTAWGPINLPLDLTPVGAAGCNLLVSFDVLGTTATDASGMASIKLPVPNDSKLLGATFHNQFFVLDKEANSLGLSWSNGGTGKVGK